MLTSQNKSFKNVLITGINGSGGYYLAKYILENHPEVNIFGLSRWRSGFSLSKKKTLTKLKLLNVT